MVKGRNTAALVAQLNESVDQIPALRATGPFSREHTKWLTKTLSVLERAFSRSSRYYATFSKFNWRFRGTTIVTLDDLDRYGDHRGTLAARDLEAYASQLETALGLLEAARDELQEAHEAEDEEDAAPKIDLPQAKYDVFLSYSSDDVELAHELREDLDREGISCFMAEKDIKVTQVWQDAIRDALQQSRFLLLLVTPSSVRRPWVLLEAGAAWALGKPIIPALAHVTPDDLIEPISKYQAVKIDTVSQRSKLIEQIKSAHQAPPGDA